MNDNNYIKVSCSTTSHKFTLLFDGLETYFIFFDGDVIAEVNLPGTPKDTASFMTKGYDVIKQEAESNELIGSLLKELNEWIKPKKKHDKTRLVYGTLQSLILTLKDAFIDTKKNKEYLSIAPSEVKEKFRDLSAIFSDDAVFDDLINPGNIEDEINARANPTLTNKEKAKADAIADKINKNGLLAYLEDILNYIHIGEHKNIYRKILMLFKIMRGEASFLSETTAKAEAGKSFEDEIVFNMIAPQQYIFKINDITLPSFRRYASINPYYFDRQIVLFGDLGGKKSFNQVEDVFNVFKVLITENEYKTTISDKVGDSWENIELNLKVDSIGAVYSTVENSFTKEDNQLISRTLYSTPAIVDNQDIMKQQFYLKYSETKQSKSRQRAEDNLKEFGLYLMQMVNSDIEIINPYLDVFLEYASKSDNPIREFNQQLELFDAYCILTQDKCNINYMGRVWASLEQLKEYMDFINLENALKPIEYDFLTMLMAKDKSKELTILYNENDFYDADGIQLNYDYIKELKAGNQVYNEDGKPYNIDLENILTLNDCENYAIELLNNEYIETKADLTSKDMLNLPYKLLVGYGLRGASYNHKEKVFFRYSDVNAVYYKYNAYKNGGNVSELLQILYNKGYLGKYEFKAGKENLYYLTPRCNEIIGKFEPQKSFNDYAEEYIFNTGLYEIGNQD